MENYQLDLLYTQDIDNLKASAVLEILTARNRDISIVQDIPGVNGYRVIWSRGKRVIWTNSGTLHSKKGD